MHLAGTRAASGDRARAGPGGAQAMPAKPRPHPGATPSIPFPADTDARRRALPPPPSEHRPSVEKVPWGAGPRTLIWGHPEPASNRSTPSRASAEQGRPRPPMSPPAQSPRSGAGSPTSLAVPAPRAQGSPPGAPSAARPGAAPGSGGPARAADEWGSPPPREPAARRVRPPAPGPADKGGRGAPSAPPQTYRPPPPPQNKGAPPGSARTPRAGTLGSGPIAVLFSLQGARRTPARAPGTVGDLPLQSPGGGRSGRRPEPRPGPRPRSLRPPAPRPPARRARALTSPQGRATCGAPPREPLRPAVAAGRAAAEQGPAPRSSRAAPAPPPAASPERRGRWKVSLPNGGRGRGGGAGARAAPRSERGGWGAGRERRRRRRDARREGPARALTSGGSGRRQSADPGREDCQRARLGRRPAPPPAPPRRPGGPRPQPAPPLGG